MNTKMIHQQIGTNDNNDTSTNRDKCFAIKIFILGQYPPRAQSPFQYLLKSQHVANRPKGSCPGVKSCNAQNSSSNTCKTQENVLTQENVFKRVANEKIET